MDPTKQNPAMLLGLAHAGTAPSSATSVRPPVLRGMLRERAQQIAKNVVERDEIDKAALWFHHDDTLIWHAKHFVGVPHFYPVYRWGDYYSYSLLALILFKVQQGGVLELNPAAIAAANEPDFMLFSGQPTLDLGISRVGGPHDSGFEIGDVEEFAARITDALIADTQMIEAKNPGKTNLVLVGGKDSMNLLLLPWKQPTKAVSALPNFPLVKEFVQKNRLPIEVIKLEDPYDADQLRREALEGCIQADLQHWRWGVHLVRIAREHNHEVVFWKGQVGDLYMSEKWKTFQHPPNKVEEYARKIYKRLPAPAFVRTQVGHLLQPRVIQATWDRCARLQGCHMAFIRALTGSLVVSAYHGPRMYEVWSHADLGKVAQKDMRSRIGRLLLGREVYYPKENPAPPVSAFRKGLGSPDLFLRLLREDGLPYVGG
jgi:hypothetical protein